MDPTHEDYQTDLGDFQRRHIQDNDQDGRIVVFNGYFTAQVPPLQLARAADFLRRTIERLSGVTVVPGSLEAPMDARNVLKGYAFMAAQTAEEAATVAEKVDGFHPDTTHQLSVRVVQG